MIHVILMAGALAVTPATQVDFRLQALPATQPAGPLQLAPDDGTVPDGAQEVDHDAERQRVASHPARPRLRGFGNNIPLDFAVKQIVPTRLHVYYGKDVDTSQAVSWHGGRSWEQTLRAMVVPLGMHVSSLKGTIRITR